jgi:hypothetical protein
MPAPYRTIRTWLLFLAALALAFVPLVVGVEMQERWLEQVRWVVLFVFILGCAGVTMEQERRRREREEEKQSE